MSVTERQAQVTQIGIVAAFVALSVYPLVSGAGVPAHLQDWLWPASHEQCRTFALLGAEPWHSGGSGYPAIYPESWIGFALEGLYCSALGPQIGLVSLVASLLFATAYGYSVAGSALLPRSSLGGRLVMSVVSIGNPFVVNEAHAGHLHFLIAYAVLPWVLLAAMSRRRWAACMLSACLAVASVQHQGLAFALLVFALYRLVVDGAFRRSDLVALLTAVIIVTPQYILLALSHSTASFDIFQPTRHWQFSQSITAADAVAGLGYIGMYDKAIPFRWMSYVAPIFAIGGFFSALRKREVILLATLGILSWLIITGLYGPAAVVIDYAFEHIHSAAAFRELYDCGALLFFAISLLAGFAVQRTDARFQKLFVIALCLSAVPASAYSFADIPRIREQTVQAVSRSMSSSSGRYLALPTPIGPDCTTAPAPFSPFSLRLARLESAEGGALVPLATALGSENAPDAASVYMAAGIGALTYVDGLEPKLQSMEPSIRIANGRFKSIHSCSVAGFKKVVPRLAVHPYSVAPAALAEVPLGGVDTDPFADAQVIALYRYDETGDPGTGWSRVALQQSLPSWMFVASGAIYTVKASLKAPVSGRYTMIVGDAVGKVVASNCMLISQLTKHYRDFRCDGTSVVHGQPPIVIAAAGRSASVTPRAGPSGSGRAYEIRSVTETHVTARVTALRGSVLVLSESYDDNWMLESKTWKHVRIDGYANGWIIPSDVVSMPVSIRYNRALIFEIASAASVAAFLVCVFFSVYGELSLRRPFP